MTNRMNKTNMSFHKVAPSPPAIKDNLKQIYPELANKPPKIKRIGKTPIKQISKFAESFALPGLGKNNLNI